MYGYDTGATSCATLSIESPSLSGTDWFDLSSVEIGLVESGSLYGAIAGCVLAFSSADFLGRRRELFAASVFYTIGAVIMAGSPTFAVLLVGRLVYGLGIGLSMHAAPMYIAETCPVEIRGTLISMKECFIVLGMLLGYLIGYLTVDTMRGWRIMYGLGGPIAVIMAIGIYWLPPSPRWILLHASKGYSDMGSSRESAAVAYRRLRGKDVDEDIIQNHVEETLQSLQSIQMEVRFSELFRGTSLKALIIGVGLLVFQQFTGQPSILYYAAIIFQSAGFVTTTGATGISVILGLFKVMMTLIAVWKVDQLGRRPLLIGGVSCLVVSLFLLAFYYAFAQGASAFAVVSLLLYVGSYQVSFGPMGWLIISEIFPLRTRGQAASIAMLVNFTSNAVVAFSFCPLKEAIGSAATFTLFGLIGVIAILFIVLKVPETKGLSLEEIEAEISK